MSTHWVMCLLVTTADTEVNKGLSALLNIPPLKNWFTHPHHRTTQSTMGVGEYN